MSEALYLVFETGGTKLVAGVAGPDCRILETTILHREATDRAEKSFRRLVEAGHQLKKRHETRDRTFRAIGFGFGGTVRRSRREPHRCLHEQGWEGLPIAATLEKEFTLPVAMENDCNLAALAEAHFGAGQGHRTVFYVTLGTGVGGGIVHDGHIQAFGDVGEAEIGHIVVVPEGPPCWCGGRGCVESVCSGPGMSQLAAWVSEQNPDLWVQSDLARTYSSAGEVSSKELMGNWGASEPFSSEVIDRAAGYLGSALAAAVNLLSPEVIVVGGGVGWGNRAFLTRVGEKMPDLVVPYFRDTYNILPSALGEQVVSQGAAILAGQSLEGSSARIA